jgi:hypothetical protein
VGEVALERYRLVSVIGQGRTGKVAKAHKTAIHRDVANEVLSTERGAEPGYRQWFSPRGSHRLPICRATPYRAARRCARWRAATMIRQESSKNSASRPAHPAYVNDAHRYHTTVKASLPAPVPSGTESARK